MNIPTKNNLRVILFLCCCIALVSCQNEVTQESETEEAVSSKIQTVEVVKPTTQSFSAQSLITGTAMPNQSVMIHAMESGFLKSIKKDIGDRVTKGELIAVLENPTISQMIAEANANVSVGQAELLAIQSELKVTQADVTTKSGIYTRLNDIYKKTPQLTRVIDVEKAEGDYRMAQAMIETINARVTAQQKKNEALQQKVQIAQKLNEMLNVKAPFSGVVTKRFVDNGAMLQSGINNPNASAIIEIQDIDPIRLTLPIPESDAGAIKKGMAVTVTFPELAGESYQAKVSRTSGALDPASKTLNVEIDINNANGKILSGMYAKAQMQLGSQDNVLSLPHTAQTMFQDQPFALVVKDGKVERVQLRKGLAGKNYFEVLNAEITKDTKVIIKGKGLVKVGDSVEAIMK
jgi:RND family efflux transporter MFP subunit